MKYGRIIAVVRQRGAARFRNECRRKQAELEAAFSRRSLEDAIRQHRHEENDRLIREAEWRCRLLPLLLFI